MKIGILTFHDADNYGAVLQAYALKETIKKIEPDVEILNYKQPYIVNNYKIIYTNTQNVISYIKSLVSSLVYLCPRIIRKIKYISFRNNYMDISEDIFYNSAEIEGKDVYIVGSDQVWNSEITQNDETYFLNFCHHEKKIAYAASIGKDKLNNDEKKFLKDNINNIDYISVREDSAVKIINDLTGMNVNHVLDPTLLADRCIWDKLMCDDKKNKFKYLLVYRLTDNEEVLRAAELISKRLNLKVLYINNLVLFKNDLIRKTRYKFKDIKGVGPSEFVTLVKNASFVVTDSFHGTAFSIIFNKDFITVPHKTRGTRMVSLLNLLKLDHRLITHTKQLKNDYPLKIDYEIPNKLLEREKDKSFAFLKNAIES